MLCSSYPSFVFQECVCVCVCVRACVCVGGLKSFLITHLSHEKHAAYIVWALAAWLIQQSSHSNCSLCTKLPLDAVFSSVSSPISCSFLSLVCLVLDSSVFLSVCTDVCLPDSVATEAGFCFFLSLGELWFDSTHGLSVLANYDRTIKMSGTCCLVLFM